jgi:hypothetical protein
MDFSYERVDVKFTLTGLFTQVFRW